MKKLSFLVLLFIFQKSLFAQSNKNSCLHKSIVERNLVLNPSFEFELDQTEIELQKIIADFKSGAISKQNSTYVIPVVMHVFHWGDDGKMGTEQIMSGLEILNQDFNGSNDGWDSIDPAFDPIKGTLDINFCLAKLDPDGNPTTGIVYHEDQNAINNEGNLYAHAWDNTKYLNIYFPKYTEGEPSDFTAYANYPNDFLTENNYDGIFYSSIRWGFGDHSELEEGDDWASVCSHEAGHWLDLRHTFESGCLGSGDLVDDTPPTEGGEIQLSGCNNFDFSCGEHVNGENFMDYNHRCKKMFTLGQIERMEAALYLNSRISLWSPVNLIETGCSEIFTSNTEKDLDSELVVYPNPAKEYVKIDFNQEYDLKIFNSNGKLIRIYEALREQKVIDLSSYETGIYFFLISNGENEIAKKLSIIK